MDFRDQYSVEQDIKCLQAEGKIVLARTVGVKGWAILWYDKDGYTVTSTTRGSRSVGAALPFETALDHYFQTIRELV